MALPVHVQRTLIADVPAPSATRACLSRLGRAVVEVLPVWVLARLIVVATLFLARRIVSQLHGADPAAVLRVHQGLLAWDGGWYESIARAGYAGTGQSSLRFFPAFPLAGRVVGWIPGVGTAAGLVIVANGCTLIALAVLFLLVRRETGEDHLARRTVWLLCLAPAAYTLVLGYAEGPLLLCTSVALLASRSRRWWWAVAAGLAAGATRPLGLLVAVPVLIEAISARERGRLGPAPVARLAAVAAPAAGTGAYLAWVWARFGDPLLPFRLQTQGKLRGPITSPLTSMSHNIAAALHGHHVGSALHIPWVILAVWLLVVAFRRLPLSFAAFAAAMVVMAVSSANLDSFERYALSAFPLVIAAATVTARPTVERVVLVAAAAGLVGYSLLAFLSIVVP